MIAQCSLPNLICSVSALSLTFIFVIDACLRRVTLPNAKARVCALVAMAFQTTMFVFQSDENNTDTSAVLHFVFTGLAFCVALYFFELFMLVYLNLPQDTKEILMKLAKCYPVFRGISICAAIVEASVMAAHPLNITQMVSTAFVMLSRLLFITPLAFVMIRIAWIVRDNRLSVIGGHKANTKVRYASDLWFSRQCDHQAHVRGNCVCPLSLFCVLFRERCMIMIVERFVGAHHT